MCNNQITLDPQSPLQSLSAATPLLLNSTLLPPQPNMIQPQLSQYYNNLIPFYIQPHFYQQQQAISHQMNDPYSLVMPFPISNYAHFQGPFFNRKGMTDPRVEQKLQGGAQLEKQVHQVRNKKLLSWTSCWHVRSLKSKRQKSHSTARPDRLTLLFKRQYQFIWLPHRKIHLIRFSFNNSIQLLN